MWILTILFVYFINVSNQWREYEVFECFRIKQPVHTFLNGNFDFERQKCYATKDSSLYNACKTDIIDGIVYSGCINTTHWQTNFLCSPMHNRREFRKSVDSNGIFIYDQIKSWCCRETLCNNLKYFKITKNKHIFAGKNQEQQLVSDGLSLVFCFIFVMILVILELIYREPIIGRIDRKEYKRNTNASINSLNENKSHFLREGSKRKRRVIKKENYKEIAPT